MRCALCDRPMGMETLGRAPDGRLVFGWCAACLQSEGCVPVEAQALPLRSSLRDRPSWRLRKLARRVRRRLAAPRGEGAARRLAVLGVAGLLALWALILAFVAGVKLVAAPDGKGPWLLAASGLTALLSLAAWAAVLGRVGRIFALKVARVALATAAFVLLAWGLLIGDRRKAPASVLMAAAALGASWLARRAELRSAAATSTRIEPPRRPERQGRD